MEKEGMKHFILVHGACHGAWCWYKLSTLLSSAGHRVTALDLAGSGVNPTRIDEIHSVDDYVQPLMDTMELIPPQEKVVLVGHSYGGLCLSLAMERFPEKISVAIFLSALMPGDEKPPSSIILEHYSRRKSSEPLQDDLKLSFDKGPENPPTSFTFEPKRLASNFYQCCTPEDLTLATLLMRPALSFVEDLSNASIISKENYGSVDRVYVICKDDLAIDQEFQSWMIANYPPKEVKEIVSDHMVMLSKPLELCQCLLEIAEKYA